MSTESGDPFWAPSVSVVGVGDAGAETVGAIETETSAELLAVTDDSEVDAAADEVAESDFCFLAGDLDEPGVADRAAAILRAAEGRTLFFPEGSDEQPGPLVSEADFLLSPNVSGDGDSRFLLATTVADLFEAMLPPTVGELGHGDITVVTGTGRIGKLVVETFDGEELDLTPDLRIPDPDSVFYFVCAGEELPLDRVESRARSRADEYDRNTGFLWDRRVHSRYEGRAHCKRIVVGETDDDVRAELLRR